VDLHEMETIEVKIEMLQAGTTEWYESTVVFIAETEAEVLRLGHTLKKIVQELNKPNEPEV
jgi:hypothetical protein